MVNFLTPFGFKSSTALSVSFLNLEEARVFLVPTCGHGMSWRITQPLYLLNNCAALLTMWPYKRAHWWLLWMWCCRSFEPTHSLCFSQHN